GNNRSPLYQLLKANRRIRAWIGTQIPGKMVQQSPVSAWQPQPSISSKTEWTPLGVYWSGDWEVPEDEVWAHTTGRDRMELLRKSTYSTSQVVHNTNLYELSEIVLKDSGLEENQYWIDPELLEFEVPYAWFDAQPHRSVLRKIAEACLGQVYADRHGIVRIEGPSFLQNERQTSQITISRDDY